LKEQVRSKLEDPNVKGRLLQAGIALFSEKGYAAASVREIVELAGVTKPALYYHFQSKEGIFLAIIENAAGYQEALLSDVLAFSGSVMDRLLYFYDRIYRGVMENRQVFKMIHNLVLGPPQGAPPFDFELFHLRNVEVVKAIYLKGLEQGEVREADPEEIATLVMSLIDFCFHMDLIHPEGIDPEKPKRLLRLAYSGLERRDERPHS
jgi:TetR/AcrR family transcriptional regulator